MPNLDLTGRGSRIAVASLFVLICSCAPTATPAVVDTPGPAPCIGNDTVYTLAEMDTFARFHPPSALVIVLPSNGFRDSAEVRALVDAHGRVVADSVKVIGATSQRDSLALTSTIHAARFRPATLGDCAVRAWVAWRVRGPSR